MATSISNFQLLEAFLKRPGATDEEIGAVVGLSRVQVSRRKNSTSFKELLVEHTRAALRPLALARVKAVRRLCEALDSPDERVALKACELVMDRSEGADEKEQSEESTFKRLATTIEKMKKDEDRLKQREENFKKHGLQMDDAELAELNKRDSSNRKT